MTHPSPECGDGLCGNVGNGFTVIGQSTLSPVRAAQPIFTVQTFAFRVKIELPACIRRVIDQQAFVKLAGLIHAVFQYAGIEGHVLVDESGGFLRGGELCFLQSSGFLCAEICLPVQRHLHTVCPEAISGRLFKNLS